MTDPCEACRDDHVCVEQPEDCLIHDAHHALIARLRAELRTAEAYERDWKARAEVAERKLGELDARIMDQKAYYLRMESSARWGPRQILRVLAALASLCQSSARSDADKLPKQGSPANAAGNQGSAAGLTDAAEKLAEDTRPEDL